MTARCALPQRRFQETFNVNFLGVACTISIGRYPSGKIGEIWTNTHKVGTTSDVLARDFAVILSIAMQYGTPLEVLARAVTRNPDGSPGGSIGEFLDLLASEEAVVARAVGDLG